MKIKIKKLVDHALIPTKRPGKACFDLYSVDQGYYNHDYKYIEYGTGISIDIPEGYIGLVFPKYSISKTPHYLSNSVEVLDSSYKGEIKLRFRNHYQNDYFEYGFGDIIGQLLIIPYPNIELEEEYENNN